MPARIHRPLRFCASKRGPTRDSHQLDCHYQLDWVVAENLLVELKAADRIHPVHEAQILTYLRLSGLTIGLLMNFNSALLKDGIRRFRM